jgi:WD40 repeat protein
VERREFGHLERALDRYAPSAGEADYRGWEWQYLRDQCNQNLIPLPAPEIMHATKWSPDGNWLATRSGSKAYLWRIDEHGRGQIVHSFAATKQNRVAWSRDGQYLAAGSGNDTVEVWDMRQAKKTRSLKRSKPLIHNRGDYGLGWNADGRYLTIGGDGWVETWDLKDGASSVLMIDEKDPDNTITALAWHPQETLLAVGTADGWLRLYDENDQLDAQSRVCNIHFRDLAWSPDGNLIACIANYPIYGVRVFDKKATMVHDLRGSTDPTRLSWSPSGDRIVASDREHLRIWSLADNKLVRTLHIHREYTHDVAWRPRSDQVASTNQDGTTKLWDADTTRMPFTTIRAHAPLKSDYQHAGVSLAWSPSGKQILSGAHDGRVVIHDAVTEELVRELQAPQRSPVHQVAWHPTQPLAAAVEINGTIKIWDTDSGEVLRTMKAGSWGIVFKFLGWSPDGSRLLCSPSELPYMNRPLYYWEDRGLGEKKLITTARDRSNAAWTPEGNVLLMAGEKNKFEIWSVPGHERLLVSETVMYRDASVAWSKCGKVVATGSKSELAFHRADDGKLITKLRPHTAAFGLAWSPDGARIATASSDGSMKIIDATTTDILLELQSGGSKSQKIAWSPDGRRLATATGSGEIRLWGSPELELPKQVDALETGVLAKYLAPSSARKQEDATKHEKVN